LSSTSSAWTVGQRGHHRLVQAVAGLLTDAERAGDRGRDHRVVGDRDEVDEPGAVGVPAAAAAATASASRVLPTPPGPSAVTCRWFLIISASSARSRPRPTNEVSGVGNADWAGTGRALARARRSATSSLRRSEEMWLSTVRTEMNSRAAISALLRCSPTSARTSASRAEMSGVVATVPSCRTRPCSGPWWLPWCFPWSPRMRVGRARRAA
jgi:hypothetical protein